jgi:hypothetical protein
MKSKTMFRLETILTREELEFVRKGLECLKDFDTDTDFKVQSLLDRIIYSEVIVNETNKNNKRKKY